MEVLSSELDESESEPEEEEEEKENESGEYESEEDDSAPNIARRYSNLVHSESWGFRTRLKKGGEEANL